MIRLNLLLHHVIAVIIASVPEAGSAAGPGFGNQVIRAIPPLRQP
jgi:hypothetical protein